MARLLFANTFSLLGTVGLILSVLSFDAFAASGITYHGRLLKPDGTPVVGTNVQFRLQIRTPGTEDCLLYEELQSTDLSASNGTFALSFGDGTGIRQDTAHAWDLFEAFSNRKNFSFNGGDCTVGSTYSPNPSDNRRMRVLFNDGTFAGWEALPLQALNYIPMSIESYAVGGFTAESLVRVETAGTLGSITPLTSAQYTEILALLGGTTTQYSKTNQLNGSTLPTIGTGQSVRWTGSAWEAYTPPTNASLPTCTAGQVLTSNGTALSCVAGGGGAVDGDDITSGTIGGTTAWNTSGNITTTGTITATGAVTGGSLSGSTVSTRSLRVYESTNTNYVTIQAPAGLTPNYTLTLPGDDGTSGQVLSTNGSGLLSWWSPSSTTLNLSQIRSTVNSMNPVFPSVACTTSETLRYDSLTDTYQCSEITVGAASGAVLNGGNTGAVVAGTNDATTLTLETNNAARMTILSNGDVGIGSTSPTTKLDVNGNIRGLALFGSATSVTFAGTNGRYYHRASDGTLTQGALGDFTTRLGFGPTGSDARFMLYNGSTGSVGGSDGLEMHMFATDAGITNREAGSLSFGTNNATRMTITSGGSVGIGTASPDRLLHVNGPIRVTAAALPGTPAAGDIAIDSGDGNRLKFHDGTAWRTLASGSGTGAAILDGGNTSGATLSVGTNDGNTLSLETNNTARLNILSDGKVGIGTSNPLRKLHLSEAGAATLVLEDSSAGSGSRNKFVSSNAGNFHVGAMADDGSTTTTQLTVLGNGNVGIGSTSPGVKLVVNGSINASGDVLASTGDAVTYGTQSGVAWPSGPRIFSYNSSTTSGTSSFIMSRVRNTGGLNQYGYFGAVSTHGASAYTPSVVFGVSDSDTTYTERMRIDSTGNLGIGTNNPGRLLHVNGPMRLTAAALPGTPGAGDLAVDSADGNKLKWHNGTTWQTVGTSSATGDIMNGGNTGAVTVGTNDGTALTLETNNLPRMTVSSAGSIGIGTTSVGSSAKVEIQGTAPQLRLSSGVTDYATFSVDVSSNLNISPGSGSNKTVSVNGFLNNSADNGVTSGFRGTFSTRYSTGSGHGLDLGYLADGTNDTAAAIRARAATSDLAFLTRSASTDSEVMRLTSSGRVGIGTNNPSTLLHVAGQLTAGTSYLASVVTPTILGGTAANQSISIESTTNTTKGYVLLQSNGGNVGIGTTTPDRLLHVNGPIRVAASALPLTPGLGDIAVDSGDGNKLKWHNGLTWQTVGTGNGTGNGDLLNGGNTGAVTMGTNDATALTLETDNSPRITVLSGGNVGIGTVTPSSALHVVGGVNLTGTLQWVSQAAGVRDGWGLELLGQTDRPVQIPGASLMIGYDQTDGTARGTGNLLVSGNVGIGTTTTVQPLTVNGNQSTSGYLRVGSSTAPANTTAGDLTASRLIIGNNALSSGKVADISGSLNETTSAGVAGTQVTAVINPTASSAASFRSFVQSSTITTSSPITGDVMGSWIETRMRGTNSVAKTRGILAYGVVLAGDANNFTTITESAGVATMGVSGFTNSATGTIVNARGVHVLDSRIAAPGAQTITSQAGITIEPLTGAGKNTSLLIGTSTIPTAADYAIYNASALPNYIAGNVAIGTTTAGYMLHVNGTAGKPGGGSWTDSSDRRLKKEIEPMDSALDELLSLKPVTYEWINPSAHQPGRHSGFIAQEVEEVFPNWVSENAPPKGDEALIPEGEKSKSLSFPHDFNAYIVKAIQEVVVWLKGHDREIASVKQENLELKKETSKLREENRAIKAYLCSKDATAPICQE